MSEGAQRCAACAACVAGNKRFLTGVVLFAAWLGVTIGVAAATDAPFVTASFWVMFACWCVGLNVWASVLAVKLCRPSDTPVEILSDARAPSHSVVVAPWLLPVWLVLWTPSAFIAAYMFTGSTVAWVARPNAWILTIVLFFASSCALAASIVLLAVADVIRRSSRRCSTAAADNVVAHQPLPSEPPASEADPNISSTLPIGATSAAGETTPDSAIDLELAEASQSSLTIPHTLT